MKKLASLILAGAAMTLALASCQKSAETDAAPEVQSVKFYAGTPSTKTVFGTPDGTVVPTLWTATNQILISQNYASPVKAEVTPSSNGASAQFIPATPITDDESGEYSYFALSPASAQVSAPNSTYLNWTIAIPESQTPIDGSVDEAAQILFAKTVMKLFPEAVTFDFRHVTAYGRLNFQNLAIGLDTPEEKVHSITISANDAAGGASPLAGRFRYYFYSTEEFGEGEVSATSPTNTITLTTDKTEDVFFACAPGAKISSLKVVIATDRGTYTKSVTLPSVYTTKSGGIMDLVFDMEGVTPADPVVYELVTDVTELTTRSEVLIVSGDESNRAMSTSQNPNNRGAVAVDIVDNMITDPSPSAQVFVLENGNVKEFATASFYASNGNATGYIYAASSDANYLRTETTKSDNSSWTVSISDGIATLIAQGTNTRNHMRYNPNGENSIFSSYAETSSIKTKVRIFKKVGSGTETSIFPAVTPDHLVITGATLRYAAGSTFAFDGTVTLVYSDDSTQELTEDEYTVNSSRVNMATPGTYGVIVTYNDDSNVSGNYIITVYDPTAVSTATLTGTDMSKMSDAGTSYGTVKTVTTAGDLVWTADAYQASNVKNMLQLRVRTNSKGVSYVKLPDFPGAIQTVTMKVTDAVSNDLANGNNPSATIAIQNNDKKNGTILASGEATEKEITLDLSESGVTTGYIVSENGGYRIWEITVTYNN